MDRFILFPWGPLHRPEARADAQGGQGEHTTGPALRTEPRDCAQALRDIAACGFNASCFIDPSDLPACRDAGLLANLYLFTPDGKNISYLSKKKDATAAEIDEVLRQAVDGLGADPGVLSFYLIDEPGASEFGRIAEMTAAVRRYAPGKLSYINLFPNYAVCGAPDLSQLETDTFEEYLDRFADQVRPDFLSLDNYLCFVSMDFQEPSMEAQYYLNLIQAQETCKQYGLPFQHVVCSNQLRCYQVIPTHANLLFQAYTSLAAGAKAIGWYTYFGRGGYLYAPVDDNTDEDIRTPTWYLLREANRQALAVGELLFPMRFVEMYFTHPDPIPRAKAAAECPVLAGFASDQPCMIGQFDDGGRPVLLVVNCSLTHSTRIEPAFAASDDIRVYSIEAGRFMPPLLTDRNGNTSPLWLAPGCGVALTY